MSKGSNDIGIIDILIEKKNYYCKITHECDSLYENLRENF